MHYFVMYVLLRRTLESRRDTQSDGHNILALTSQSFHVTFLKKNSPEHIPLVQ